MALLMYMDDTTPEKMMWTYAGKSQLGEMLAMSTPRPMTHITATV